MSSISSIAISVLVIYAIIRLSRIILDKLRQPLPNYRLPPGPLRIPIVGYMPFLARNPQNAFNVLAEKYGDIVTIYIGNYRVVVLNDFKLIRDAFKEDVFSGRPTLKMLEVRNQGVKRGLVCSEGREWNEQRKFTLRQLRDLGLGKKTTQSLVLEELEELVDGLREEEGQSVNIQNRLTMAVLNVIWQITCGERYKHDDPRMQIILQKTGADLAETQYTGPLLFLPWLIDIAPGLTRWNQFVDSVHGVHEFLANKIQTHKATYEAGRSRDFIDSYLAEIDRTKDVNSSFYDNYGEHSLLIVLLDIFMAGADTTSTTLYWAFLYMILYPNVQAKIQTEIDEIIGKGNPSAEHRKKMPYTEATMLEILRKSSLVPLGLFHGTTADTNFAGYFIPKETVIVANLHMIHNSKAIWGDPENFRPGRFLHEGQLKKHDELIPFSTGKRVCPGENLAKDEFFLFLVGLLQKFTFAPSPTEPMPTETPKVGIMLTPNSYYVTATSRNMGD